MKATNFLNLMKSIIPQIQEDLNKRNMKETTPKHNITKCLKPAVKSLAYYIMFYPKSTKISSMISF